MKCTVGLYIHLDSRYHHHHHKKPMSTFTINTDTVTVPRVYLTPVFKLTVPATRQKQKYITKSKVLILLRKLTP